MNDEPGAPSDPDDRDSVEPQGDLADAEPPHQEEERSPWDAVPEPQWAIPAPEAPGADEADAGSSTATPGEPLPPPADDSPEGSAPTTVTEDPARAAPSDDRWGAAGRWEDRRPGAEVEVPPEQEEQEAVGRARTIAVANQKGGVGKSTTAVNLGAALAEAGNKVLVVDMDPQGNASTGLGIAPSDRRVTIYQILFEDVPAEEGVVETDVPGLWAITSTIDLAGAEIELVSQFSREMRLSRALARLAGVYDYIILDCPPSLGLLTVNALAAADELIVPIQCEYYALEGLGQLLRNVRLVQQNLNTELRLTGIVLTMFDSRTKLAEQVVAEVRRYFGRRVYDSLIPRSVRLSEAPGYGQPITVYDPSSRGAFAYRSLAQEVAAGPRREEEALPAADPPAVMVPERARGRGGGPPEEGSIGTRGG